jgi:hypothetical protein
LNFCNGDAGAPDDADAAVYGKDSECQKAFPDEIFGDPRISANLNDG